MIKTDIVYIFCLIIQDVKQFNIALYEEFNNLHPI